MYRNSFGPRTRREYLLWAGKSLGIPFWVSWFIFGVWTSCARAEEGREWSAVSWAGKSRIRILEQTLGTLDGLARRRGRTETGPTHLRIGVAGEEAAQFFLRRKGYTVVARRWSAGNLPGDLDLVAWQGSLLCFFEVKTRTAHDMAPAESAVDTRKRNTLRRLARQYIHHLPAESAPQSRFDVISVYLVPGEKPGFVHFENAFGWRDLT